LSDIEFVNKQIQKVQSLNTNNHSQTESSDLIYSTSTMIVQSVVVTALKTCEHYVMQTVGKTSLYCKCVRMYLFKRHFN